jgi:hypothetical protein
VPDLLQPIVVNAAKKLQIEMVDVMLALTGERSISIIRPKDDTETASGKGAWRVIAWRTQTVRRDRTTWMSGEKGISELGILVSADGAEYIVVRLWDVMDCKSGGMKLL